MTDTTLTILALVLLTASSTASFSNAARSEGIGWAALGGFTLGVAATLFVVKIFG